MKSASRLNVFVASILWMSLSACGVSIPTPTATLIPASPTPVPPTASPTTILLPIFVTPSAQPTQPVIPVTITPNPAQMERWKKYEEAMAKAMFRTTFIPGEFLCEWEILGQVDREVYIYAVCMSISSIESTGLPFHAEMPLTVHLEADEAIQRVEIPGGGSNYASDIREMFPPYARDRYFNRLISFQTLTDHLKWRRTHPEEPPLIVFSSIPTPQPTQTGWLPYNPNGSDTGCHEFVATIPVTQAEGLSQEETIKQLFEIYLDHYKASELGVRCRLEDYKIENILLDKRIALLANEQNLDYVGSVQYSVQIKELPSWWVAGNGELANDGWIVNKGLIVGVTKVGDEYALKLIGTGP